MRVRARSLGLQERELFSGPRREQRAVALSRLGQADDACTALSVALRDESVELAVVAQGLTEAVDVAVELCRELCESRLPAEISERVEDLFHAFL